METAAEMRLYVHMKEWGGCSYKPCINQENAQATGGNYRSARCGTEHMVEMEGGIRFNPDGYANLDTRGHGRLGGGVTVGHNERRAEK